MDEEQAIFEQLTLSDLKKWTTTALKRALKCETIFGNRKPFKK